MLNASSFPPSKSLYNRALILKSFESSLAIKTAGDVFSEDVHVLQKALNDFNNGAVEFYCASGAAPLKFLAIRLSRSKGSYTLRGTPRLFSRPLDDLMYALQGLGCEELLKTSDAISFRATGVWPEKIKLNPSVSSQVLSAVLLSAWNLDKELTVELDEGEIASSSYLEMTLNLMKAVGWGGASDTFIEDRFIVLPKKQKIVLDEIYIEPDMSCVAALSLAALVKQSTLRLGSMLSSSLQGDFVIFKYLQDMGFIVTAEKELDPASEGVLSELPQLIDIVVRKGQETRGIEVNLFSTPDLFPVLASFCVSLDSPSTISGLENLNYKESRRLDAVLNLLNSVGVDSKVEGNALFLRPLKSFNHNVIPFDPDQDHRMAMAAEILRLQGAPINILNRNVVDKSFPNFWGMMNKV